MFCECLSSYRVQNVELQQRRSLLKCVASVFDPPGLVAPAVLPGKILLQKSWKLGGDWDKLPDDISAVCGQWWRELAEVVSIVIPRWICCNLDTPITLQAFADASEKACGCSLNVVGNGESHFVLAKAKVAPVSLPALARLELSKKDTTPPRSPAAVNFNAGWSPFKVVENFSQVSPRRDKKTSSTKR